MIDLNPLKHDDVTSHAKGDLQQEADPDNNEDWTLVVGKKSSAKKTQKIKTEPTPPKSKEDSEEVRAHACGEASHRAQRQA